MAKYQVLFASTFEKELAKLDRQIQKRIMNWIAKHLVDVDFPTSPGKTLKGNLRNYVRFRVGDYRIITIVDNHQFTLINIHVGHRKEIYNLD